MTLIELNGRTWSYVDAGAGPVVLLVHGWACDSGDWAHLVPTLLRAGYRTIVLEVPGHGSSPAADDGYYPEDMAAGLAALLDRLEVPDAVVVGHSYGGSVAVAFAEQHRAQCRAIVLVDGAYGRDDAEVDAVAQKLLPALDTPAAVPAVSAMIASLHAPVSRPDLVEWHERRAALVPAEVSRHMVHALLDPPDTMLRRPSAERRLGGLTVPVLAFHAASTIDLVPWVRACLKNDLSDVHAWAGAGHWLHLEQPDQFGEAVLGWLDSLQ